MTDESGVEHYSFGSKIAFHSKRVWFEFFSLLSIFSLIYFTPVSYLTSDNPKLGIISLFISKFLFVSAGTLHAHIIRKLFFPYIKFDKVSQNGFSMKGLLVVVLYGVVIFSWARGG
jgi:hypothetical protein